MCRCSTRPTDLIFGDCGPGCNEMAKAFNVTQFRRDAADLDRERTRDGARARHDTNRQPGGQHRRDHEPSGIGDPGGPRI